MPDLINAAATARPASPPAAKPTKNARVNLTPKGIERLRKTKAAPGKRDLHWDQLLSGFAVRITDRGHASFVFGAKYPGSKNWTLREIGPCTMTLEAARAKAKGWIELIAKGIDPRANEAKLEQEEARKRADTFSSVAEAYIADKVLGDDPAKPLQRNGKIVARTLRSFGCFKTGDRVAPLLWTSPWKNRPIAEIGRDDVREIIKAGKRRVKVGKQYRGGPEAARASLGVIKSLLSWALDQGCYGLERNAASDIMPNKVIGDKTARSRVLTDDELAALWRAADRCEYPIREAYQLLMLTGLRLNEVCGATWNEFDFRKGQWVIAAERMKGKESGPKQSRSFLVPLNAAMLQILNGLPRFNDSNSGFLFTTTRGRVQYFSGSKVKRAIDALMLVELQKIATERGDDPRKAVLPGWTNHDIRRSFRSNLSKLKDADGRKIPLEVKEAVLAHTSGGGIIGVYDPSDLESLSDEKREALELWAARLFEIVNPPAPDDGVLRPAFRKARNTS